MVPLRAIMRFLGLAITPARQVFDVPDAVQVIATLGFSALITSFARLYGDIPVFVIVPTLLALAFLWAGIRLQLRLDQQPKLVFGEPEEFGEEVDFSSAQHWRITLRNIQPHSSARDVRVYMTTEPKLSMMNAPLPLFALNMPKPYPLTYTLPYGRDLVLNVLSYDNENDIYYLWRTDHFNDQVGPLYMIQDMVDKNILDRAIVGGDGLKLILSAQSDDGQLVVESRYLLKEFDEAGGWLTLERLTPQ